MSNPALIDYYQSSQWLYRLFCYDLNSLGMHFGYWRPGTKNIQEALINQNEEIRQIGKVSAGMKLLDAGCGVGGTAIYLARRTGAWVWGISLDYKQIRLAEKYARYHGVSDRLSFSVQDYTGTNFTDNFFDIVYAIESVDAIADKQKFLREAKRILKPGGRVIIADGYLARSLAGSGEKQLVEKFSRAFALPGMITVRRMTEEVKKAGFKSVRSEKRMDQVRPSVRHFAKTARRFSLLAGAAKYIPVKYAAAIYQNYEALMAVDEADRIGLADYAVCWGVK